MSDFRIHLQEELVSRCRKNPRYSLRSFARALGVNHGILSLVLRGERKITPAMVQRMGLSLNLGSKEINAFLAQLNETDLSLATRKRKTQKINQLTVDVFNVISDWYHDAILELSRTRNFSPRPEFLSKRLGITVSEARAAVERLERVGLLEIAADGSWIESLGDNSTVVGVDDTSVALRALQKQVLQLSTTALESVPKKLRDHSCMTMAIDMQDLPAAKKRIQEFRHDMMAFMQRKSAKPTEVFQLAVSLYPITNIRTNHKNEYEEN